MPDHGHSSDSAIFRVGRVVSVQGRTVEVEVDVSKNSTHLLYKGRVINNVSVGGHVRIAKGFTSLIAKIDGERISDAKDSSYRSRRDRVQRVLTLSLIGYFDDDGRFHRGVREMPLIDNECFILNEDEFDRVHSWVDKEDRALTIGSLAMEKGRPVRVGVNTLFASHVGIFGNTGSGKSYSLAKLYYEFLAVASTSEEFCRASRLLFIDFNGEYVNRSSGQDGKSDSTEVIVDPRLKTDFNLSTRTSQGDRLPIGVELLSDPGLWSVLLDATEKTQVPFIRRALTSDFWESQLSDNDKVKATVGEVLWSAIVNSDSNSEKSTINRFLRELADCLDSSDQAKLLGLAGLITRCLTYHGKSKVFMWKDESGLYWANDEADLPYFENMTKDALSALDIAWTDVGGLGRVQLKLVLQFYSDTFRGFASPDHLGPLMKRLDSRMPQVRKIFEVSDQPLLSRLVTVVSLRDVNLDMKKIVPLILAKQVYEEQKISEDRRYLNIVIDEAHNTLSSQSSRESDVWKDYRLETFEEIVKEGRKFGVFLTIASQRPHDISESVISQLHNYLLHRLVNNLDISAIQRAVSYLDKVSFESLPILPTGTCVLAGVLVDLPVVVNIGEIPGHRAPNNRTMNLTRELGLAAVS